MAITEEERIHVARDCVMILNMKVSSEEKKRLGRKYLEGYSHEDRMKILNTDITTMDEEDYYTFLTEFYGEGINPEVKAKVEEAIEKYKEKFIPRPLNSKTKDENFLKLLYSIDNKSEGKL